MNKVTCCECGKHGHLYFTKWKATVCKKCYELFYKGKEE